ncbi:MAG: hypothetical protein ACI353_01410 [Alloprevotella sp.]
MHNLLFKVAGVFFRVIFHPDTDGRPLLPSFPAFFVKEKNPVDLIFEMQVDTNPSESAIRGKELGQFDCGGANHGVYVLEEGGYSIHISTPEGQLACILTTNADFSACRTQLYGGKAQQQFGLNNALMIAFAFAGSHHGILLMHASVPMLEGRAYLFLGKSGTGKSTHCKLWLQHIAETDLLNDDNPAVRAEEDGSIGVYGTPWSGKTPCYRSLRCEAGGFLRLEQYPENVLSRQTGVQAFASVLSSCSTMLWDKPSYEAICRTVEAVVRRVPVFYLKNLPNREAALMSYHALTGHNEDKHT